MHSTKFPINICMWCNEENPTDNHKMTCAQTFKPKKFVPTSQWISVKDRLPEKTISVLIFNGSFIDIGAFFCDDHFITEKGSVLDVTHWMPLPEAPK